MLYRQQGKSDIPVLVGLMIFAVVAAYFLEAVGECVRSNVASIHTPSLSDMLDHLAGYHLLVSVVAGLVLYAGLYFLSRSGFTSPSSRRSASR
jgi:hypothetical protein